MSNLLGALISQKYRLERFLGEGGLGRVYLATHTALGRPVALKLLHPELCTDAGLVARFSREALAASRVSHPNTVVIHDFGSDTIGSTTQLYLVMEYLVGQTLHDRIQGHPKRRLPTWEAVHILSQVLRPLEAFHRAGVIHRDLKPDNIMLCRGEVGEVAKLLDFGIAKVCRWGFCCMRR
jgi:serine/threonine-protein kinase